MWLHNGLPQSLSENLASRKPLRSRFATERRVVFLLLLIACQLAVLKFIIPLSSIGSKYNFSMPGGGGAFQPILYFGLGFLLLLSTHFHSFWRMLIAYATPHRWWRLIIPQAICYLLIIYSVGRLSASDFLLRKDTTNEFEELWMLFLVTSLFLTTILSFGIIAPKAYWAKFAKKEITTVLLALCFPASYFFIVFLLEHSQDFLRGPTMQVVEFFLHPAFKDIQTDPHRALVGTQSFAIIIDRTCVGYEGIGMMAVFLTWYLAAFKKDFRFPFAFLLFPIGITTVWLFNCLRLALLIFIGSSFSPDIAMQGFHNNAGWIFFIAVSIGTVFIARKMTFFCKRVVERQIVIDHVNALAIPFLVLLAATLISSSFSGNFQWLYPIRIVATGLVIFLLWKYFDLKASLPGFFPVFAGIFVFLIWIALNPPSFEVDKKFSGDLFNVPIFLSIAWIIMRLAGSVIVIPIAEELAFRGYLINLFPSSAPAEHDAKSIQWIPFIISSVLFGALHSFWITGTIAGAVYYLVKLRSGRLWDAIMAHMTTNLLLSAYVLASGHWSYW